MLRIRFQYPTGAQLGYSIERLGDETLYDFADGTFKANPTTPISKLPEDTGTFVGRFRTTLTNTPVSQWTDGAYCVTVHNTALANDVVAELDTVMRNGDDQPLSAAQQAQLLATAIVALVGKKGFTVVPND